jgi:hypothetical protein
MASAAASLRSVMNSPKVVSCCSNRSARMRRHTLTTRDLATFAGPVWQARHVVLHPQGGRRFRAGANFEHKDRTQNRRSRF